MKKILIVGLVASVGFFTACTTDTPKVEADNKVNTEVNASNKLSDKVVNKAVSVAKGAAVSAATKKVKDMSSKKK